MNAMPIGVLTAIPGAEWEAQLVSSLNRSDVGLRIVRRCVDLPDLLAAAAAGTASAVLLSADLRRLDRDAVARLAVARIGVVGLVAPHDDQAATRLRHLGISRVLPADAAPAEVAAAVLEVVTAALEPEADRSWLTTGYSDMSGAEAPLDPDPAGAPPPAGAGRLIAVWGPTGAPGRTTVALGLAAELAASGTSALLADADTYGGAIAIMLGLLDESPGLAAVTRMATAGTLDQVALARLAPQVSSRLRVLSGISRAARWPELRPAGLEVVWARCRGLAAVTVVDVGFCLEQDEELSYDTSAPRRNGVTLATIEAADTIVAVGSADPLGVHRLIRGLEELREVRADLTPLVVLNRLRSGPIGARPLEQVAAALKRYAGISHVRSLPFDPEATDAALREGRTLPEVAPSSALRRALAQLAADVGGAKAPVRGRRRHRRAG